MAGNSQKNPNPQGKGQVPVLADWQAMRPGEVGEKAPALLLLNWFVSTLVLSAEFSFRPVVGVTYHLYLAGQRWKLSLIGPDEWGDRTPGVYLGACLLRRDTTWDLQPCASGLQQPAIRERLAELADDFVETLDGSESVREALPGYRRNLPYYQRMLATALGSSLRDSAQRLGMLNAPGRLLLNDAPRALEQLA